MKTRSSVFEEEGLFKVEQLDIICNPDQERFDILTQLLCQALEIPIVIISSTNKRCHWFNTEEGMLATNVGFSESFYKHTLEQEDVFVVSDATKDTHFMDIPLVKKSPKIHFYAGKAIQYHGHTFGVLSVMDYKARDFNQAQQATLKAFVKILEQDIHIRMIDIEQQALLEELNQIERQLAVDSITQLWNYKGFIQVMESGLHRAKQEKLPVGLILINIDHFKVINDRYGSVCTDQILQEMGRRLRNSLDANASIGHISQEEFVILLSNCNIEQAMKIAKILREALSYATIPCGDERISVTVSMGVVSNSGTNIWIGKPLLQAAAEALYVAKAAGRDRIFRGQLN